MKYLLLISLLIVAACSTEQNPSSQPPEGGAHYKVGEPYQIKGETYYPREDYSYDETGIASWYGQDFHGGTTANGEIFNKDELTAAHKTLPLPTLARVTNLDNGKSIVVRINDRGPFSGSRLIDLSQRGAQLLGFEQSGTAKVRVQVLADESKAIADAMRHYGSKPGVAVASAESPSLSPSPPIQEVQMAALPSVESANLAPIKTTPEVHQQLLHVEPVQQVVQLAVTGPHQLYVQAGSFSVHENAIKLMQHLSKIGKADITNVQIKGVNFYRVRVGPVNGVSGADRVLAQVRSAGASEARIIVD